MEKRTWLRVSDFADQTGLDEQTIRRALRNGELRGFKVGHQWLIPIDQFEPDTKRSF